MTDMITDGHSKHKIDIKGNGCILERTVDDARVAHPALCRSRERGTGKFLKILLVDGQHIV